MCKSRETIALSAKSIYIRIFNSVYQLKNINKIAPLFLDFINISIQLGFLEWLTTTRLVARLYEHWWHNNTEATSPITEDSLPEDRWTTRKRKNLSIILYSIFLKILILVSEWFLYICKMLIKGTVSRDFRPLVFFTNQPHLGPWLTG
jgi:hypothetical protein